MRTAVPASRAKKRHPIVGAIKAQYRHTANDRMSLAECDDAEMFGSRDNDFDETMRGFRDAFEAQAADDRYD